MPKNFKVETKLIQQVAPVIHQGVELTDPTIYDFTFEYEFYISSYDKKQSPIFLVTWDVHPTNLFNQKVAEFKLMTGYEVDFSAGFISAPYVDFMTLLHQSFGHLQFAFGLALKQFNPPILSEPDFYQYEKEILGFRDKFVEAHAKDFLS